MSNHEVRELWLDAAYILWGLWQFHFDQLLPIAKTSDLYSKCVTQSKGHYLNFVVGDIIAICYIFNILENALFGLMLNETLVFKIIWRLLDERGQGRTEGERKGKKML